MAIIVRSEMAAIVASVDVAVGDAVTKNQAILTLEAMKMQFSIVAPTDGRVVRVAVVDGDVVSERQELLTIDT